MRVWQSVKSSFGASGHPRTAGKTHNAMQDASLWDTWWKDAISRGRLNHYLFPMIEAPLVKHLGAYYDVVNSDSLLVAIMAEYGLKSVLCAGNGLSQEPRALALAGFDVTAVDISPAAVSVARAFEFGPNDMLRFCDPGAQRTAGHLDFVVGSLLDTAVCPGPFDVIIERRTVQRFGEQDLSTALLALAGRLAKVGIFLSHSNDIDYCSSKKTRLFHASESWFREQGWTIWDGAPGSTMSGRVAWLVGSTG